MSDHLRGLRGKIEGVILCTENRELNDKEQIENALKLGEYIKKGAYSLYFRHCRILRPP